MDTRDSKEHLATGTANLRIKKSTFWAFASLVLFKITLDLSYYLVISQIFGYMGLRLNVSVIKLIEAYLLFFLVFCLMPKSSKSLSNVLVWLLILLSYIPMLTLFALKDESRIFMYMATGFWLMVFLLLRLPAISLPSLKQAPIIRTAIFAGLTLTAFWMVYEYIGFSFNFNLARVYEVRTKYTEAEIPFAGYVFDWVAYIVNPILLGLFVARKRWILSGLIIGLEVLLFSSTGNKTFLFAPLLVIALMWIVSRKNPIVYLALGLVCFIVLGMSSYWLLNDVWISSLFTRRTLLTPAQLYFLYYDFFSEHGPIFLSTTRIFRSFLDYPYELSPPHLIGEVYFDAPEMGANTGIIGDAYMNFGFMGLFLWGILLAAILKLIDCSSKRKDIKLAVAAIAMPGFTLANSALLTCLLTHGLLLALLLLYLLPKKQPTCDWI